MTPASEVARRVGSVGTDRRNVEERILGLLMGLGVGVFLGFFLRDRPHAPQPTSAR
jgi:hypothetical protein